MSLKICQYKLPKLKCKEKKRMKIYKKTDIQELWDNFNACNICITIITEEEERYKGEK